MLLSLLSLPVLFGLAIEADSKEARLLLPLLSYLAAFFTAYWVFVVGDLIRIAQETRQEINKQNKKNAGQVDFSELRGLIARALNVDRGTTQEILITSTIFSIDTPNTETSFVTPLGQCKVIKNQ